MEKEAKGGTRMKGGGYPNLGAASQDLSHASQLAEPGGRDRTLILKSGRQKPWEAH